MLENSENIETEEIGLVTPTLAVCTSPDLNLTIVIAF